MLNEVVLGSKPWIPAFQTVFVYVRPDRMLWRTENVSLSWYSEPSCRVKSICLLWSSLMGRGVLISPKSEDMIPIEWNLTSGSIFPANEGIEQVEWMGSKTYNQNMLLSRLETNHSDHSQGHQAASLSTFSSSHPPNINHHNNNQIKSDSITYFAISSSWSRVHSLITRNSKQNGTKSHSHCYIVKCYNNQLM